MTQQSATISPRAERIRLGRMPIPHEHGAWVILYAPLVVGFVAARALPVVPALLLVAAVTGVFLTRNAAALLLRRRAQPGSAFWLALYAALAIAAGAPLLTMRGAGALVRIGVAVALLFAIHAALTIWPARRRLDRSQWGEMLAVGALTLTGPAAYAISRGTLDRTALLVWAACALYFGSSIFFVKMLLGGVKLKAKGAPTEGDRWRLGRDNLLYHGLMLAALPALAAAVGGGVAGLLLAAAYLPAIARGVWGWRRVGGRLPSLKRLGLLETAYSLWFLGCASAALLIRG